MHLLELADRVEALSGPCRETDAAIVMALYPEAQIGEYCGYEDIVFHARPLVADKEILPFFTGSLDAAMMLVPECHFWHVGSGDDLGPPWAWVGTDHNVRGLPAATPALALVVAALRARHSIQEGEG